MKDDPLIREHGLRRFVGVPMDAPFHKNHVEISYCDPLTAEWMYAVPTVGRLPAEGTDEAATDTRVLELLGVTPALGARFPMTFDVDGTPITKTFTLCGWWDYDAASTASHVLIPMSLANIILDEAGVGSGIGDDGITGSRSMEVMLHNSLRIEDDMWAVLANHGFQCESRAVGDNYIPIGVNWGYTGAQLADAMNAEAALAIGAMLALIILTGYLIIYNVFQISVVGDIRFYGMLKTIGATAKQLRRILLQQALLLSLGGIPVGLLLGWAVGALLTPSILNLLSHVVRDTVSLNPLIFLFAALFSLVTVLLSCSRPARMAGRVSPVEAVRYTEGSGGKRKVRRVTGRLSLPTMALANLSRSRGKTAVTIVSLALAVVLTTIVGWCGSCSGRRLCRMTTSSSKVSTQGKLGCKPCSVCQPSLQSTCSVFNDASSRPVGISPAMMQNSKAAKMTTASARSIRPFVFPSILNYLSPFHSIVHTVQATKGIYMFIR